MRKIIYTTVLYLGYCISAMAQTGIDNKKSHWELEVDPIAYALNGFSVHGIYQRKMTRFDLGVFGIKQPEGFSGNKGFAINSMGAGMKVNCLLNKNENWFAGVGAGYLKNDIQYRATGERKQQEVLGLGIHAGYRFYVLRKIKAGRFYVAPWMSIDYNIPMNEVAFEKASYKTSPLTIFPTIHIGYRFR